MKQAAIILIATLSFILRERTLALAKTWLPHLPYGKAVAIGSMLISKFPTNEATKKFYQSARPRWKNTFVFQLNPYCPLSKLFALTGLFQPEMTAELLKETYQGTLVDIGANFGYFSVLWLSKRNGDALAIEPIRQNYELLTINLRPFGRRAKAVMRCLGEEPGFATMSYDPQFPMLSKITTKSVHSQEIAVDTLRDVLKQHGLSRIDVMKCDAEGYDVRILRSAHEIFEERRVRVLFFETETWDQRGDPELEEFNHLLLASGYRLKSSKADWCYFLP